MEFNTKSTSTLSSAIMIRKRPRTQPMLFDLPSTSALTSLTLKCMPEKLFTPNELVVMTNPIDNALAELDVGLGLGCTTKFGMPLSLPNSSMSIEEELDAAFAAVQKERERKLALHEVPDDTSCVSGSGGLGQRAVAKVEDSSAAVDVLHELEALESRASTTVMSPPLAKSYYKRRRR